MPFDTEEWVRDNMDSVKRSTGDEFAADCPFCGKPGHFYVNVDTNNYICFKCEAAGRGFSGLVRLVAEVEGVKTSVARRMITRQVVQFKRRESEPKSLMERLANMRGREAQQADGVVQAPLPDEFIPVWKHDRGWRMPMYLKQRGITRETAKTWGLGYCDKGRYADRIVFPIVCPNGQSFTARDATEDQSQQPKYLNPKGVDHGRLLYGWNTLGDGDVIMVEGPMDVLTLVQRSYEVLGLLGKALHVEQMKLLLKLPRDKTFIIMLDPEETEAPYKVAKQLLCRFERVYVAKLPGVDPNEATREQTYQTYKQSSKYKGSRLETLRAGIAKMKEQQ